MFKPDGARPENVMRLRQHRITQQGCKPISSKVQAVSLHVLVVCSSVQGEATHSGEGC